ncbi:hypothetical protein OC844_006200 [Tilletia horrida]|nr:hypothetical protein OC844_006200 [Tilletia horrida]
MSIGPDQPFGLRPINKRDAVVAYVSLPPDFVGAEVTDVDVLLTVGKGPEVLLARLDSDRPTVKLDLLLLKDNSPRLWSTHPARLLLATCASVEDLHGAEDASMAGVSTVGTRQQAVRKGETIQYKTRIVEIGTGRTLYEDDNAVEDVAGEGFDKELTTPLIGKKVGQEAVVKTPSMFRRFLPPGAKDHETVIIVSLVKFPVA